MKRLLRFDWDVIAGILAAVVAIVLHLLHIAHAEVLLTIILVMLALLLLRDLRQEGAIHEIVELLGRASSKISLIHDALQPPDALLIGPRRLKATTASFSQTAQGDMVWYNVCPEMFRSQDLFDQLVGAAISNPKVTALYFILDEREKAKWEEAVEPKLRHHPQSAKVQPAIWRNLEKSISFVLAEVPTGKTEALLSFWGEPFMAKETGRELPRYIFHVQSHSELIGRLSEIERNHRL